MKVSKSKSKFSSALNYFVKKTAIGSLIGVVMISSTLMVSPDLVAHANKSDSNDVAGYELVAKNVAHSAFKDVSTNHYAYEAILWAKDKGIVNGYPGGTFKPDGTITEAHFAKMIVNFLGLKDNKGDLNKSNNKTEYDTYYDALASYGVPLNGYFDTSIRNKPVKRGVIAQAIGHLTGNSNSLTDSINFMLIEGITTGQNQQYEGKDLNKFFGSQNNLTRAQVAAFLYRMNNVDVDEAIGISLVANKNNEGLSLVGLANKGMNKLDSSLRVGKLGSENNSNSTGNHTITYNPNPNNNNNNTVVNNGTSKDYSDAKIPVASDAKKIDVNVINKLVSKMSDDTYKKIIKGGYEVNHTNSNSVTLNDDYTFILYLKESKDSLGMMNYDSSVPSDLVISLIKELYGVSLTKKDLYPGYENNTNKYIIENFGESFLFRTK